MHRLTITLTAPNELDHNVALRIFASQLEDVAEDLTALPAQTTAFGAFGDEGCKVYYRLEIDDPEARQTNASALQKNSLARQSDLPAVAGL